MFCLFQFLFYRVEEEYLELVPQCSPAKQGLFGWWFVIFKSIDGNSGRKVE